MPRGIPRDKSVNRRIVHRLKIIRGHLDKVISMVENGEYCIDITHQLLAIKEAVGEVSKLVLRNHILTCLANSIEKEDSESYLEEVIRVIEKA